MVLVFETITLTFGVLNQVSLQGDFHSNSVTQNSSVNDDNDDGEHVGALICNNVCTTATDDKFGSYLSLVMIVAPMSKNARMTVDMSYPSLNSF